MANHEAINKAIDMIAERIISALSEETNPKGNHLGFHNRSDLSGGSMIRAWIGRCGQGERYCWYHLAGDRDNPTQQPIEFDCVSGKLVDLQLQVREFKGKENQKLVVSLEADSTLISVTVGLDTVAGRSIIRGLLGHLEKGPITGLITLQVRAGDAEGTVLASVLHDGEWAYSEPLQDPEHAVKMIQHQMKFTQRAQSSHDHAHQSAPAAKAPATAVVEELPF